jgi:hypothetical protein
LRPLPFRNNIEVVNDLDEYMEHKYIKHISRRLCNQCQGHDQCYPDKWSYVTYYVQQRNDYTEQDGIINSQNKKAPVYKIARIINSAKSPMR